MGYLARILADSVSPDGARLFTVEATFPRFILAEVNTHRMISKNTASSRAIPTKKRIEAILADPFIPDYWGKNERGMVATEEFDDELTRVDCKQAWLDAMYTCIAKAEYLDGMGLHKQLANRLLEPFSWVTGIWSGTEWANFFHLRCAKSAQPEFRRIAIMVKDLYYANTPVPIGYDDWHLPLVWPEDREAVRLLTMNGYEYRREEVLCKVSVGRCARVSYLTHDGRRDIEDDLELANRLSASGHWSPFEHVAQPSLIEDFCGNFFGWTQYRKTFFSENRGTLANDPMEYEEAA